MVKKIILEAREMKRCAYVNAVLLDGTETMESKTGLVLFTEGEMISAIVPAEKADLTGCDIVDLKGKCLLPGLINLHVHLPASGMPKKKESDPKKLVRLMTSNGLLASFGKKLCAGYAKQQLLSGTTTIRTVGGVADWDTWVRDGVNAGKLDGPRVLAGNMAISVPGGHMAGSLAYEATSPAEAVDYVNRIAAEKPDLIKLMITGGVLDAKVKGEPGVLKMPPEMVKAACDAAHANGLAVAAHVESPEGVRVALENGVDTIEHGAKPDEEILRLFKERHAALVTTLSPALPYALFDRSVSHASEMAQFNGMVVFQGIQDCAKACLEAGIPVGLGTDTGCAYVTHTGTWREPLLFQKYCGVSNAFALYTATLGNAKIAKIDNVTGSLEVGKAADMIAVEKNPLEDLHALRDVKLVVARGKRYDQPKVKRSPQVEEELDKFM